MKSVVPELSSVMERADALHRENPNETFAQYRLRKYTELEQFVSSRRMVYLDMKYWIWLRDPAEAPEHVRIKAQRLLEMLKSGVNSGLLLCPLSYAALLELRRINPLPLRLRQAEVMDELSGGIGIRNQFEIAENEILSMFVQYAPPFASVSLDSVWTRISHIIGEFYPESDQLPFEIMERGRKVMLDVQWAMGVQHLVQRMDAMPDPKPQWAATCSKIDEERKKHPRGNDLFAKLFSDEMRGVLESHRSQIRNCWSKGARRNGIKIEPESVPETDVNEVIALLCGGVKTDSANRMLSSHRVYAALHAAIRTDDQRPYHTNDLPDLQHAALAAAYFDVFLTEDGLSALLNRPQVRSVISQKCKVVSSIDDAIAILS